MPATDSITSPDEESPRKTYYEANKEAILAKAKARYEANKEVMRARARDWYQANKETVKARRHAREEVGLTEKPPSGAELRRRRVAKGLPRNVPADLRYMRRQKKRKSRIRSRRIVKSRKDYISAIKLERGCVDCGFKGHPVALDFDHLPGSKKIHTVSRMCVYARSSFKDLDREIAKCEVVCSNCHRIRTWRREQENKKSPPD